MTPPNVPDEAPSGVVSRNTEDEGFSLNRDGLVYQLRAYPALAGRLRATIRVSRGNRFHVDTIDLLLSKSRTDYARKAAKAACTPARCPSPRPAST